MGAFAVVALGSAGTANASCASFSGINSSSLGPGQCTTTTIGDTAIGIGTNTTVIAEGGFNTAIAIGEDAQAASYSPGDPNFGNTALAIGKRAIAGAIGVGNSATAIGDYTNATTNGTLNRALVLGYNSQASAWGVLNSATTIGKDSYAGAGGGKPYPLGNGLNTAITLGDNSHSGALGTLKLAAALGNNKTADNGINNK
jgi:hypothetical protein